MAKRKKQLSPKYQPWVDARTRLHLSHAHIQMARELRMNPKKLGRKDNHEQEPWKLPLPQYIEELYFERFGKPRPDVVRSIEEMVQQKKRKKQEARRRRDAGGGQAASDKVERDEDIPF